MFQWLKRTTSAAAAPEAAPSEPLADQLVWREDADLPIPDWALTPWPQDEAAETLHRLANGLAAAWLDALAARLPVPHWREESPHFMLLSPWRDRTARVLLDYLERSRRRVLAVLAQVADDQGHGKTPVMVFSDEDAYYRYIAHYAGAPADEPQGFSGGMFIDHGYGHFVFAQAPFETMEPTVVHELTHCLVRHLPLPAWLNEGLAVNTERRLSPPRARYQAHELSYLFGRFWNEETLQQFWSGKSFLRPDEGQALSYELARLLVQLLDKDYARLAAFCNAAHQDDAGEAAAHAVLGAGLGELAGIVLGEGDWSPRPERWTDGTEKGQFRLRTRTAFD